MSYDESMSIWVGDLDDFVHIYDDDDYYTQSPAEAEFDGLTAGFETIPLCP